MELNPLLQRATQLLFVDTFKNLFKDLLWFSDYIPKKLFTSTTRG